MRSVLSCHEYPICLWLMQCSRHGLLACPAVLLGTPLLCQRLADTSLVACLRPGTCTQVFMLGHLTCVLVHVSNRAFWVRWREEMCMGMNM